MSCVPRVGRARVSVEQRRPVGVAHCVARRLVHFEDIDVMRAVTFIYSILMNEHRRYIKLHKYEQQKIETEDEP